MQKNNKILSEAFTFDDVLLKPGYSDVLPGQVDVSTYLTRNIKLYIPSSVLNFSFLVSSIFL